MITQAIKEWLQKVFAWWPWKQSTSIPYQPVTSAVSWVSTPEPPQLSNREGSVPQAGTLPRRSTLEGRSERIVQARADDLPPWAVPSSAELLRDAGNTPPHTPSTQQRLEFLRYLVQRGIVNEGFEENSADF